MVNKTICPRCLGYIPSNVFAGQYCGAISRVDNKTEICSDCGTEEATLALVQIDQWPIILYNHPATQYAFERWQTRREMDNLDEYNLAP